MVRPASLKANIVSLFLLQSATYVLPLASLPYLARTLGVEDFGRVALALALMQYFVLLTDYGFHLSATRRTALLREDRTGLMRLVSAVTLLRALFCVAGALLLFVVLAVLPMRGDNTLLYGAAYLAVVGNAAFPAWLLQGLGNVQVAVVCSVFGQISSLVALFVLVRGPDDYLVAAAVQSTGALVAAIFAWIWLSIHGLAKLKNPPRSELVDALRDGWPLFLSSASVHLYTTSNIVLLGLFATPAAVGQFAVADKLMRAAQGLIGPVSQSVYPHVARLSAESTDRAMTFIRTLLRWQALATFAVSAGLFVLAEPLVQFLFGASFAEAAVLLRWLAPLPFIVGLSNVLGVQTMLNFGMERYFSRILLACGALNLGLLLLLAPAFGAQGAAASVLFTEACVVLSMLWMLRQAGLLPAMLRGSIA